MESHFLIHYNLFFYHFNKWGVRSVFFAGSARKKNTTPHFIEKNPFLDGS
jgi:hypothetical protein